MSKGDVLRSAADGVTIPPQSLAVITEAVKNYTGDVNTLEGALGGFILAHYVGYEPLRVMHSPVTMRKWASILGIDWLEYPCFEAVGPLAERSNGYRLASKLNALKDVIYGRQPVPDRRVLLTNADAGITLNT